jgi:hypothetical protein
MNPKHLTIAAVAVFAITAFAAVPADYKGKPFSDEYHQTGPANIPGIVQCALYDPRGGAATADVPLLPRE